MPIKKFSSSLITFFLVMLLTMTASCNTSSEGNTPADDFPNSPHPSYTAIVPPGFPREWNPGIPGGIPHVTNIYTTINASDYGNGANDAANAINNAIYDAGKEASPANRQVVQLSAGTFRIDDTILLDSPNVVLRGQGAATVIQGVNGIGMSGAITIGREWTNYSGDKAVEVEGSPIAGDTLITVADASIFSHGDILILDRLADDNGSRTGNNGPGKTWRENQVGGFELRLNQQYFIRVPDRSQFGPSQSDYRPVKQYVEIDYIEGNTLYLTNKINIDFPAHLKPQVYLTNAERYQYIGLEDMKLEIVAGGPNHDDPWEYNPPAINISFVSSYCWVKNVESDGTVRKTITGLGERGFKARHITMQGFRNVVTGCYVHDSYDNRPGGNGYGIEIHGTDGLIDNNIADLLCKPILGYASGGGNVIAYNYVPNTETGPHGAGRPANGRDPESLIDWQETAIDMSHASYSHSDLYEGNYAANISTDNTSGNNGQMVVFRNYAWGRNLNNQTKTNLMALLVMGMNNEHASIGNVWLNSITADGAKLFQNPQNQGNSGQVVYRISFDARSYFGGGWYDNAVGYPTEGWAMGKFHRHLDYNYVENSVYDNTANTVKELPPSLYLTSAPDYFDGYTWPPVNPFGETHDDRVGRLPAMDRYPK